MRHAEDTPDQAQDRPGDARTRVRRIPEKQVHDLAVLHAVLDAGLVAHVGIVDDGGQPFVMPVAYARDRDRVLFHGSTGSRLFRALSAGLPTCFTVTLLDGLVLARSAFESSMNYRGAVVLGRCAALSGDDKELGLRTISEHLMPGRWADIRPPSRKELAATTVVALPLDEWSVKVSEGPPEDLPEDLDRTVWAGVVPVRESFGDPIADDGMTEALPGYVSQWER